MLAPVFIMEVPRSGTTLVAARPNPYPRITVTPAAFVLEGRGFAGARRG